MKKILLIILFLPIFVNAQNEISGFVYDKTNGEVLIGANIFSKNSGTYTNAYGFFVIHSNSKDLTFSYVGYKQKTIKLDSTLSIKVDAYLEPLGLLNEVVLTDTYRDKDRSMLSSIQINSKTISELPVLLGEADVFKSIQLLPGVTMGEDGSSDFYVRGGSKDQNLIMIDDVPIFTSTHSAGYFSAINNEVIRDVQLYKGAFPARYSGRVSSVLDIRTREGNTKKINSSISISPFIFQSTFETPIVKNKSAIIIGYRHSLYDLLLSLTPGDYPLYGFNDMNIKYHHSLGDSDKILFNFYRGSDSYRHTVNNSNSFTEDKNKYNNMVASARWNHVFKSNIFVNTTVSYNKYNYYNSRENKYTIENKDTGGENDIYTNIYFGNNSYNFRLKSDFDYRYNSIHTFQFGGEIALHKYEPENIIELNDGKTQYIKTDTTSLTIKNTIARMYLEDRIKYKNTNINVGVNFAWFNTGEKHFYSIEPRLSIKWKMSEKFNSTVSYSVMSQNLHLITQTGPVLPEDVWFPSTDSIPPVFSQQFSAGFSYANKSLSISTEGFYKKMNNVTEKKFSNDANSTFSLIEVGKGWSYGIESMVTLDLEKIMINLNYTWSRSMRKFDNLNFNKDFPFKYDRPHDLKIFGIWSISNKWKISSVATWKSGSNTTLHQANIPAVFNYVDPFGSSYHSNYKYYGDRNTYRLPSYFRWDADISYSYKGDWGKYVLKFGVYNITNHHNAQKLEVSSEGVSSTNLIPLMPYISYSWRLW